MIRDRTARVGRTGSVILIALLLVSGCHTFEVELDASPEAFCIDEFELIVDGVKQRHPANQILTFDAPEDAVVAIAGWVDGVPWMTGTIRPQVERLVPVDWPVQNPGNMALLGDDGVLQPSDGLDAIAARGVLTTCHADLEPNTQGRTTVLEPTYATTFTACGVTQPLDTEFVRVSTASFPLDPQCELDGVFPAAAEDGPVVVVAGRCPSQEPSLTCEPAIWYLATALKRRLPDSSETGTGCTPPSTDEHCRGMTVAAAQNKVTFLREDHFVEVSISTAGLQFSCPALPPQWTSPETPPTASSSGTGNTLWLKDGSVYLGATDSPVVATGVSGIARDMLWTAEGSLARVRKGGETEDLPQYLKHEACDSLLAPIPVFGNREGESAFAPSTLPYAYCREDGELYMWSAGGWQALGSIGAVALQMVWAFHEIQPASIQSPEISRRTRDTLWAQSADGAIHVGRVSGDGSFTWLKVGDRDFPVGDSTRSLDLGGPMTADGAGSGLVMSAEGGTELVRVTLDWGDCPVSQ